MWLQCLYLGLRSLQHPCYSISHLYLCRERLLRHLRILFFWVRSKSIDKHAKPRVARKSGTLKCWMGLCRFLPREYLLWVGYILIPGDARHQMHLI
jgi:hypothetical protein